MGVMNLGYTAKRALDYSVAVGGLLVGAPFMAAIAVAIKVDSPGTVLFTQERLGRGGKPFQLMKFRTMRSAPLRFNADGSTMIEHGDGRITRVGRWLRGGLDELPQLVNILRGEMSLIGPRPDLVQQRALYEAEEEHKLDVLPGITSLPVVLGRNEIPWKKRVEIDVAYIDRWSLALDLKIFVETIAMAVGRHVFDFEELEIA